MAESNSGGASRVFMFAAILLGVLAMVMAFAFIQSAANVDNTPTTTTVVAARDLPANTQLNPDTDFTTIKVPAPKDPKVANMMASRALDPNALASYRGQRINRFIPAGGNINNADIGGQVGELALAGDQLAMSISVRGSQALAGLLVPGDFVRLYVTRPRSGAPADGTGPSSSKWESVPVLTDPVKVLAVNNRIKLSRQQVLAQDQFAATGTTEAQQTVTLSVTEPQAQAILAMSGASQLPITLLLTPPSSETSPAPPASRPKAGGT